MGSRTTAALLTAYLLSSSVFAQAAPDQQQFTEEVAVSYVMIPFTALGTKGDPITNLREGDVALFVDGVPVRSDMFERSMDAPVSFTILVDGSGSMELAGKMQAARAAISALLERRKKGDDFSLYVFNDENATELVPFTTDANKIIRALLGIKPYGKTAFFDALADMPEKSLLGNNPTQAIILLSDGIDNASQLTRAQIAKQLEGVAIPIFALGLREPGEVRSTTKTAEESANLQLLTELASLTGGRSFIGNQPEQLSAAIDAMEESLRAQYLIGFSPTGKGVVKYRRISVRLPGRARSVRVRAGYRGTEPPVLSAAASQRGKNKRNERKGS
ncbi:MAG TPA: VWA domain-containing protein [Thermoanaerobaculia bacterium]|nr:VWA domain-containing protein [Thermoanaerobaculia bacterium]